MSVEPRSLIAPEEIDETQALVVKVEGMLPDTCHSALAPTARFDIDEQAVLVDSIAYLSTGPCRRRETPFAGEARVQKLPPGHYVVMAPDGALERRLVVRPARR